MVIFCLFFQKKQFVYHFLGSDEDSQYSEGGWIQWFCGLEDHNFFCEIDEEFIKDNFNLYGLKQRFNHYK